MIGRKGLVAWLCAFAGLAGYVYLDRVASRAPDDVLTGPTASRVLAKLGEGGTTSLFDNLPPSGAGIPSARDLSVESGTGGSAPPTGAEITLPPLKDPLLARGQIERVYVRVAQGMLVDLAVANAEQRDGWRYASIDFPDPLANGSTKALALLTGSLSELGVGDVVEMRFAPKTPRSIMGAEFFMGVERDRVTQVLGRSGTTLAQNFERRIQAHYGTQMAREAGAQWVSWKSLPLERAFRIVHGSGANQIAVFSDPNCVACQAFEQTLQQLDDVTLHVFMVPLIRPDLAQQSKSIWCSPDKAKAWLDLTLRKQAPAASPGCDNPVEALMADQQSIIDLRATPTTVLEDGQRMQGNVPLGVLRQRIAAAASAKVAAAP